MDFGQLAAEMIRVRRGSRTQKSMSRVLGYRSNVLFAWENGHDEPNARAFFLLVSKTGDGRVNENLPGLRDACLDLGSKDGLTEYLRNLAGDRSISELSALLQCDRYRISRWLRGQTEINLSDLLRLVDVTSLALYDFIESFVDPRQLPSVASDYERFAQARSAALRMPWSHAIVHMADLPSYKRLSKHEPGWFASRLGVTQTEESECLAHLVGSGQLSLQAGRYTRPEALNLDTRPDPQGTRRLAAFWLEEGARRVLVPGSGRFSFNTFAVSKKDLEQIKRLQGEYFQKLRAIVDQSEPTEAVAVATFQLIALATEPD